MYYRSLKNASASERSQPMRMSDILAGGLEERRRELVSVSTCSSSLTSPSTHFLASTEAALDRPDGSGSPNRHSNEEVLQYHYASSGDRIPPTWTNRPQGITGSCAILPRPSRTAAMEQSQTSRKRRLPSLLPQPDPTSPLAMSYNSHNSNGVYGYPLQESLVSQAGFHTYNSQFPPLPNSPQHSPQSYTVMYHVAGSATSSYPPAVSETLIAYERRGKWTYDEERFTRKMTECFLEGILPLEPGVTLRSYLAERLRCNPMRVSKKLASLEIAGYAIPKKLGKKIFRPKIAETEEAEQALKAQQTEALLRLSELEKRFLDSLERLKLEESTTKRQRMVVSAQSEPSFALPVPYFSTLAGDTATSASTANTVYCRAMSTPVAPAYPVKEEQVMMSYQQQAVIAPVSPQWRVAESTTAVKTAAC